MDNKNKIEALTALETSVGWGIIKEFLDNNIKAIGDAILDDIDSKLSEKERTEFIQKRYYQRKLLSLPQDLKKKLEEATIEGEVDFDPFE